MPYARRSRKAVRSRRSNKTRAPRGRGTHKRSRKVSRKLLVYKNPLPQVGYYKFDYLTSGLSKSLNLANTYQGTYVMRGNGLFDPDYTGTGSQPYGFDQLCAANSPFQRYQCYSSKIKIYLFRKDPTNYPVTDLRIVCVPSINAAGPTNWDSFHDLIRMPKAKALVLRSADQKKWSISNFESTHHVWPTAPRSLDFDFSAPYNTVPPKEWFWFIYFDGTNNSADQYIGFDIKITYYCKLTKENAIDES